MIERQKWIDHKFNLDIDLGWTQNILTRLQDTEIRLSYYCQDLSDAKLSQRLAGWSIKEHIGHLADLEILWIDRFEQFAQGLPELIAADMSNKKTNTSNHNELCIETIINRFKTEREKLLTCFNDLNEKHQNHQAMHPRIQQYMRPVDLLFFIAEHDDHHIVSIKEIKNTLL